MPQLLGLSGVASARTPSARFRAEGSIPSASSVRANWCRALALSSDTSGCTPKARVFVCPGSGSSSANSGRRSASLTSTTHGRRISSARIAVAARERMVPLSGSLLVSSGALAGGRLETGAVRDLETPVPMLDPRVVCATHGIAPARARPAVAQGGAARPAATGLAEHDASARNPGCAYLRGVLSRGPQEARPVATETLGYLVARLGGAKQDPSSRQAVHWISAV